MKRFRNSSAHCHYAAKGRKLPHEIIHNNLCNPLVKMVDVDNIIFLERIRVSIDDLRPVLQLRNVRNKRVWRHIFFGFWNRHASPDDYASYRALSLPPQLLSFPVLLIRKNTGSIHCWRFIVMETCENISTRFTRPDDPILHHCADLRPRTSSVCRLNGKKRVTCVRVLRVCQSPWLFSCKLFFLGHMLKRYLTLRVSTVVCESFIDQMDFFTS